MTTSASPAQVGILILSYHEPEATLACVRRLLEVEGDQVRVFWLENDADATLQEVLPVLRGSGLPWVMLEADGETLPEPGQIGFLPIGANLGYGGGNNVGLRYLQRTGVPYAWVMNNDTLLVRGSSLDLLKAAQARPGVGLWGMEIASEGSRPYVGCRAQARDFATGHVHDPAVLETDALAYISGCAMFFRTEVGLAAGAIPEDYFLYYEDVAFSWAIRALGLTLGVVDQVRVLHAESLASGRRSARVEYYNRRNRWLLIHTWHPRRLRQQELRFFFYQLQKLLFRGRFARIRLEWLAYRDFKAGRLGRSLRF